MSLLKHYMIWIYNNIIGVVDTEFKCLDFEK